MKNMFLVIYQNFDAVGQVNDPADQRDALPGKPCRVATAENGHDGGGSARPGA